MVHYCQWQNNSPLYLCAWIYELTHGHLDCFYLLPVTDNAYLNIYSNIFGRTYVSFSLRCMPRATFCWSYVNSGVKSLRNWTTQLRNSRNIFLEDFLRSFPEELFLVLHNNWILPWKIQISDNITNTDPDGGKRCVKDLPPQFLWLFCG